MKQLDKDYNYCHNIMKTHSKTFSNAFEFLKIDKKRAVWTVYAVCRIIDDSIDRDQDLNQLLKIESDLDAIYNDDSKDFESNVAIMRAFKDTLKYYAIPHQPLLTLIQYVKNDLELRQIKTEEQFFNYCYGVAGTVGELLIPILASKNHSNYSSAREAGIDLGKAMQITNILRDVGEDFKENRVYISEEKLNQYEIKLSDIYQHGVTKSYINLWESYAYEARLLYEKALNRIKYFDEDVQYIIELAARAYFEILEEVRKSNYTLHTKVYVNKVRKISIYNEIMSKYKRRGTP